MSPQRKRDIKRLSTINNKRKLNALFHIYKAYRDVVSHHLKDPISTSDELNVFYRGPLIKKIKELVEELKIDTNSKGAIKPPSDYIPFPNLFLAEDILQKQGKTPEAGRIEAFGVYGFLKELAEEVGAVNQPTIPEVEGIIWKIKNMVTASSREKTAPSLGTPPKIFLQTDKWYIQGPRGKVFLSRKKSLYGEFLNIMIDSWGTYRDKDTILERLNDKTRKGPWILSQIITAMKGINKKMHASGVRRLFLDRNGNMWMLMYSNKDT